MLLWFASVAFAADVGIPLEPMSTLPWEVAAPGICGATTNYDGDIVMHRWWVRDDAGRLLKIVNQQVGRESIDEERFEYDAAGRLVEVEQWQWRPPTKEPVPGYATGWLHDERTTYLRDAAGRLARIRQEYVRWGGSSESVYEGPGVRDADVVWSADRRTATEAIGGLKIAWTFDEKGVPLTASAETNGRPEVETWHRDCATFPALPRGDTPPSP